jgi:hypothetical protein
VGAWAVDAEDAGDVEDAGGVVEFVEEDGDEVVSSEGGPAMASLAA